MRRPILKTAAIISFLSLTLGGPTLRAGDGATGLKRAGLFLGGRIPSPEEILRGPAGTVSFGRDDVVHCVYWDYRPGGTNPKFGCFRAAPNGSYLRNGSLHYVGKGVVQGDFFDSLGTLRENVRLDVAKAVFVGVDGRAISAFEPALLKIKYNDTNCVRAPAGADFMALIEARRRPPYRKARDMYTEVASTRLLWALGYPAQPAYTTAGVVCHGCPEDDAFRQKGSRRTMVYVDAMVDRPYPDALELSTWSVKDVADQVYWKEWPIQKRVYFDGLIVLAGLIHHRSNARQQNSLVCLARPGSGCAPDAETFMLFADLGSTFGAPHAKGQHSSWIEHPAWADARSCRVYLPWKDMPPAASHLQITEAGRRFILERIGRLTDDHLRAVFRAARFEWVDGQLRLQKLLELFPRQLAARDETPRALLYKSGLTDRDFDRLFPILSRLESRLTLGERGQLDAAVIEQWTLSFKAKVARLATEVTTCRNTVASSR